MILIFVLTGALIFGMICAGPVGALATVTLCYALIEKSA